jgi:hypothetical protein
MQLQRALLQYTAFAQQLLSTLPGGGLIGAPGTAGLLANGAAVVGGIVPGGAIVSAAVSSVGSLGGSQASAAYIAKSSSG